MSYPASPTEILDATRQVDRLLRAERIDRYDAEDLRQDALRVGLEKFDPAKGASFATYAVACAKKLGLARRSRARAHPITLDDAPQATIQSVDAEAAFDAHREVTPALVAWHDAKAKYEGRKYHDTGELHTAVLEVGSAEFAVMYDASWGAYWFFTRAASDDANWSTEADARRVFAELKEHRKPNADRRCPSRRPGKIAERQGRA